jgi:signal transduction histidine kinase
MMKAEFSEGLDPTAATWLEAASASLERMRKLVQDILEYSRTGSREAPHGSLDLKDAVDDALFALGALISKRGAKVDVGQLPTVEGNSGQLSQLFQNLVANAVKFVAADTEPQIQVCAERHPDGWLVSVIDNGPGVPPDARERVFDMFHRGRKADGAGTGLGLAIAKKVVTAHSGRIWIEAAPDGTGSAFRFVLPGEHA